MQYTNQFAINLNEVARIKFFDFTNISGEETSVPICEIVMHIATLKAIADTIYSSLKEHEKSAKEALKQAN